MATPEGDVVDQEIVPQIRIASSISPNLQQQLSAIQRLARQVFEPDIPASQYDICPTVAPQLQLDNWNTRLRDMDSAILYVTIENFTSSFNNGLDELDDDHDLCLASMQRTVDAIEEQYVAFFFVHPRVLPDAVATSIPESYLNQQKESYHIYLAAVRPDTRGRGLFQLLLDTTIVKARLFPKDV
ncbi:hypothetical protein LTR64_001641 [Lithohypha guttulata]|uniref:uncharacterized protein n=1 Tax=Lithohypha guttulata TaxID=1690604 RepID=UPI002DDE69BC|nr:hypothetical protein LTR51_003835 [Lithohypha guttulata]